MIRAYLRNPWQTAAFLALAGAALAAPACALAAAVFFCLCEIVAGLRKAESPRWWPSAWPRPERPRAVIYDATCRLCARSKAHLETWPTGSAIRFVPLQSPEARELVPHLKEEEFQGAMHVVEEGKVYSGADGWYRLMRLAPIWSAWVSWVVPRALARPVYAWVARNRYRWFGRVPCEAGTCAVHPTSGRRSSSPPSGSRGPSSPVP